MTRNARVIAVTSGKGGVGKTHISANLGVLFAKTGKRVCVIDADHGLANINLILGIPAVNQPHDLFEPDFDPTSCMIESEYGIDVLPSASGISQKESDLRPSKAQICVLLTKLKSHYDVILVDTAAGIDEGVRNYLSLADHALLVINSEPTSLTDAFGLIRRMKDIQPFYNVLINRVNNAASATSIYKRFAGAVRKYIGAQVTAIGYISEDSFMSAAVLSQTPVVSYSPSCLASQCLRRIVRTLGRTLIDTASSNSQKSNQPLDNSPETIQPDVIATPTGEDEQPTEVVKVKQAIPAIPKFIRNESDTETFDNWLSQINQFFDRKTSDQKSRQYRTAKFLEKLEQLCDGDPKFLADLESIVVQSSDRNSDSVIEQTAITERLANTRFVEEPVIEENNKRVNQGGVSRAFSIISKLK
jgi:MinD-like ATPase involved in chromosome partitioning or flagellar assembly